MKHTSNLKMKVVTLQGLENIRKKENNRHMIMNEVEYSFIHDCFVKRAFLYHIINLLNFNIGKIFTLGILVIRSYIIVFTLIYL